MAFRNDAFLWYNVPTWAELGLAVPNFGDDKVSQNGSIRYLVSVTGRNLAAIMWHSDARSRVPPTINTITRMHKLITRARDILAGRAVAPGTLNMESAHAVPPESFLVFPSPYFKVRNEWLKEYASYVLLALTEAMQHTENGRGIEISQDFAGMFGQYLMRVYKLMATELLKVAYPTDPAEALAFTLTDAQISAYNPAKYFTSTELIDTVPDVLNIPTEDDLKVLTDGLPTINLPPLSVWPTVTPSASPAVATPTAAAVANPTGAAFSPAPGA